MCFRSPAHGSFLRDSAFVNGSRRQHRDYAEEIRVILLQSQATDIGHHLSILSGGSTLFRALLASSNPARGWRVDEVCFGLSTVKLYLSSDWF
jgi:hypothetical protein